MADRSWDGQWYSPDQIPLENPFEGLDVEALTQTFNLPNSARALPSNTLAAFQNDYSAAMMASTLHTTPTSGGGALRQSASGEFGSSFHAAPAFSSPIQSFPEYPFHSHPVQSDIHKYSPYSSQPTTPQTRISSIVPSQQFHQIDAAFGPPVSQATKQLKRSHTSVEIQLPDALAKRRRSQDTTKRSESIPEDFITPELSDDEKLLIELKQERNMPWKDISREFEERLGRPYQVPALQMRYKRLRERLRPWRDEDVSALEAAHEFWETNKYEIIAQKMLEFGVQEKWPAKLVERKWLQKQVESDKNTATASDASQLVGIRATTTEPAGLIENQQPTGSAYGNLPSRSPLAQDLQQLSPQATMHTGSGDLFGALPSVLER